MVQSNHLPQEDGATHKLALPDFINSYRILGKNIVHLYTANSRKVARKKHKSARDNTKRWLRGNVLVFVFLHVNILFLLSGGDFL